MAALLHEHERNQSQKGTQDMIYEYLQDSGAIGAANAKPMQALCSVFGLQPTQLKKTVQQERKDGALICSDAGGYYIAQDRAEIAGFYKATRAAAISRLQIIKPFRAALREQDGQQELFED